jgi:hypothetical protein
MSHGPISVIVMGCASATSPETSAFWDETVNDVHSGDDGRRKRHTAAICEHRNLLDRLRELEPRLPSTIVKGSVIGTYKPYHPPSYYKPSFDANPATA